jgi:hypothetical protein
MIVKVIAVRLKSIYHGNPGFEYQGAKVLNSGLEKRDPALRNITEALYERGVEYSIDDCSLYWFLIEDDNDCQFYLGLNEVELAFEAEWFESEKARIRGFAGQRYYSACEDIAQGWLIKDQTRPISYTLPRRTAA